MQEAMFNCLVPLQLFNPKMARSYPFITAQHDVQHQKIHSSQCILNVNHITQVTPTPLPLQGVLTCRYDFSQLIANLTQAGVLSHHPPRAVQQLTKLTLLHTYSLSGLLLHTELHHSHHISAIKCHYTLYCLNPPCSAPP